MASIKEPEPPMLEFRIETEATVRRVYTVNASSQDEALEMIDQLAPDVEEDTDEEVTSVRESPGSSSNSD